MHDARNRQPFALACAALLALVAPEACAQAGSEPAAISELRAAKLMEAMLAARNANAGEWKKIEAIYADLAEKFPRDAAVRNGRAEFLWDIDEHERALGEWKTAEQLDPKNARVLHHLAGAYLDAGNAKLSATYHERARATPSRRMRATISPRRMCSSSSATS